MNWVEMYLTTKEVSGRPVRDQVARLPVKGQALEEGAVLANDLLRRHLLSKLMSLGVQLT